MTVFQLLPGVPDFLEEGEFFFGEESKALFQPGSPAQAEDWICKPLSGD